MGGRERMPGMGPELTDAEEVIFGEEEMMPDGGMIDVGVEENAFDEMSEEDLMELIMGGGEELPEENPINEFSVNLADYLDKAVLDGIGEELCLLIENDVEARKKRAEQYEEGIKRTGLGNDAPGGADFPGASRVVHPMLAKSAVDFAATASKELLPPDGPVRAKILNEEEPTALKRAERKKRHMNYVLMHKVPEFVHEHEQCFTQLPLGGDGAMKWWWEDGRPNCEFLTTDRVILPYYATGFTSARRRTLIYDLEKVEIERRVREGIYIRGPFDDAESQSPEQSGPELANEKVEGKEETGSNLDGVRRLYEVYVYHNMDGEDPLLIENSDEQLEGDGTDESNSDSAPGWYIITIDELSKEVVAIYRNWDEEDFIARGVITEIQHVVPWGFIPWEGAYHVGMTHIIGSISGATTGALRALLDSAMIQNTPGGIRMKGARTSGENINPSSTAITEIDGVETDDIRKVFMPFPYAGPSPVLFQLLGFLVEQGQSVVATASEKIAEVNPQAPVGTTLALIEQGAKVMSSIHMRMHRAMAAELQIVHRLLAENMSDEEPLDLASKDMITAEEYQVPMDVMPVSDPNIFAEAQRYAMLNEVVNLISNPVFQNLNWDVEAIARRILEQLKVPDPQSLLPEPPEPQPANAVEENVQMTNGAQQQVFPHQDHEAHLVIHLLYLSSPIFGQNRIIVQTLAPAMLQHIKDHLSMWYAKAMGEAVEQMTQIPMEQLMQVDAQPQSADPEQQQQQPQTDQMSTLFANVASDVVNGAGTMFQQLPAIIEMTTKLLEELNPNEVQIEAVKAQGDANLKIAQAEQIKAQVDAIDSEREENRKDIQLGLDAQIKRREQARKERETDARIEEAEDKRAADLEKAAAQIESSEYVAEANNETRLTIAEMQNDGKESPSDR